MSRSYKKNSGFTLNELMVAIAVIGIFAAAGIPRFSASIKRNRLATHSNTFIASLQLARSEAIKRQLPVSVRKLDNNSATQIGASVDWESGWDVFTDADNDGNFEAGDVLIRTFPAVPSSFTLRGHTNLANYINFLPTGLSNNSGSFVLCDNSDGNNVPEAHTGKLILVSVSGRASIATDADHDGIPEKSGGSEISSCTTSPF